MNAPLVLARPHLPVAWCERPLHGPYGEQRIEIVDDCAPTIAEIVAVTTAPAWFKDICEVRVVDVLVPRERWRYVRPRIVPGRDISISLTLPHGEGKNPVVAVASIAVLLAAVAVSQGALTPWLPAALAPYAGATVGVVGSLAISALVRPPPQLTSRDFRTASLGGNQLAPGQPVPRVIGTHLVYPSFITPPLIEVVGDEEIAEAVLVLAGPHQWDQVLFDGTDADDLSDVVYETFEGREDDIEQVLVPRQSYTTAPAIEISQHKLQEDNLTLANQISPDLCVPVYHNVVSRKEPDEVWIVLNFIEGLGKTDGTAFYRNIRMQFRQQGGAWKFCPQFTVKRSASGSFKLMVVFKWETPPSVLQAPPTDNGVFIAYNFIAGSGTTAPMNSPDWTAEAYFGGAVTPLSNANFATTDMVNVELATDRITFYLDPATYPPDTYEFKTIFGSTATTAVPRYDVDTTTFINLGTYQTLDSQNNVLQKCAIERVSSIRNDNPCPTHKFAQIAVKARGRSIQSIGAIASGLVYDTADDINWDVLTTSSNPATNYHEILAGTLGVEPVPTASIDNDSLFDWRTDCIAAGYEVNAVVEGKSYLEALDICAAAGYARRVHNNKWTIYEDKDRSAETPVQIFTPRNARDFSWKRAYIRRPSGLRAFYNDSTDNYRQKSIVVYDDASSSDANRLEQATYDGLVTEAEAQARATYDLAQTRLRYTFYSFLAAHDSIVCQRGSMVGVQHDILAIQAGSARIKQITRSAASVTGLTLDGSVPVDTEGGILTVAHLLTTPHILTLGAKTGIAIRLLAGNGILTKEITGATDDDLTEITFVTPFADPGTTQLDADCLCAVGPLASEYSRLIVTGIIPTNEMWATISAVDEAPALWS